MGNNPNKPTVYKKLVGRLGNQMFQYASALGIARAKHANVCILSSKDLEDERNPKEDLENVCVGYFGKCSSILENTKIIPEKKYAVYDMKQFLTSGNIEIETDLDQGFLQSWKYFENVKEKVKEKFRFIPSIDEPAIRHVQNLRKHPTDKIIGIHIRRGDHISLKYLRFPPKKYFEKAKNYFLKKYGKNTVFVIATNDRKWAEKLSDSNTLLISHTKSSPEDMAILSHCDGVIMSIGTFGWWGGYLCGKDVVYFKKEFVMSHPINRGNVRKEDYYLPEWVGL